MFGQYDKSKSLADNYQYWMGDGQGVVHVFRDIGNCIESLQKEISEDKELRAKHPMLQDLHEQYQTAKKLVENNT